MAKIRSSRIINAPYEKTWAIASDFGNEARWSRVLKETSRDTIRPQVGSVRTCRLERPVLGKEVVQEDLLSMGDGFYCYQLRGGAGPVRLARNTWTLEAKGAKSKLSIDAFVKPKWWALPFFWAAIRSIKATAEEALDDFAAYVEAQ